MSRITHFEILADNVEATQNFYRSVFGWEFKAWEGADQPYWMIMTGPEGTPGINGGLAAKSPQFPLPSVTNTLDVADVDAVAASVVQHGGAVLMPKMAVPTIGWMIYFKDNEGNVFGAMQMDPEAK